MKWLSGLLFVSSVLCHAQNPVPNPAGQRMLHMGALSLSLPDFLQPVVWQKDRCRMTMASIPVGDTATEREHAFATMEKWSMPEKKVFLGRYNHSYELGQPALFLLSRIPPHTGKADQPDIKTSWQPGIRVKSVMGLDNKVYQLSADCETREPETAIAITTQNLFQPYGPLPDTKNKASSAPLSLDTDADGPEKAYPRFVAQGKGITVSIVFNDTARSNEMVPMTMRMRLLHAMMGKPGESVSYVRHGEKKAGKGTDARTGKENIYGVTRTQKDMPQEESVEYMLRAHWHDDQTRLHIELNWQGKEPIPEKDFLALWDQLLASVVFNSAQP